MTRKLLTYITILAITVLPIQLISASVATVSMQMSMDQPILESKECLHERDAETIKAPIEKSCCNEQTHDCQNCNNCPQAAASVMIPYSQKILKISLLKITEYSISHLVLNGAPQKNLLRPPRTQI